SVVFNYEQSKNHLPPQTLFSSIASYCRTLAVDPALLLACLRLLCLPWIDSSDVPKYEPWMRLNQRRTVVRASNWTDAKSPYETLDASWHRGKGVVGKDADEEKIKLAYRRLAKFYHPDGGY
ncbi:unnamed protein product, partial [Thlaspi arvense]